MEKYMPYDFEVNEKVWKIFERYNGFDVYKDENGNIWISEWREKNAEKVIDIKGMEKWILNYDRKHRPKLNKEVKEAGLKLLRNLLLTPSVENLNDYIFDERIIVIKRKKEKYLYSDLGTDALINVITKKYTEDKDIIDNILEGKNIVYSF